MMDYVKKHSPSVVIAENVKGITAKNDGQPPVILHVADAMKRAGYHFGYKILNTSDFLIPQSRNRCWMIGLRRDKYSQCDVEDVFDMIEQMKSPAMELKKYFQHFCVGRAGMPVNKAPNARQKRVIKVALKKVPKRSNRDQVIVDVAKSEQRAPVQLNRTPCLVANSAMFWHNEERFLSAEEVLALQGIFTKDFKAAKSTFLTQQRRLCHDLTGNAFSMSGGADGSAGVQPSVSRAGDPLVGFLVESSRNLRCTIARGLDGFETIPAPQKRPDSLGSVAIASPTSTSSEVVHQPLTPQVRPSRGSSSEISASLPRVGAGPLPPLPEAENQEDPQDYPADPELGSDSDEQTEESASGTEESGESEDASENSEMHAESEKLAVELHAEFRRRPRDNSGTRFMQMLEDALWDTCKFRPPQIKCKTLEFVENAPKVLGGWNVTLWIYSLKPSMNSDLVVKNVNQLVEKYEEWAGEDRTGDFFQKYAWVWCKFKAGKDQPYKECKPSGVNAPKNDSSQRHGALREDIAEETVVQDTRIAPAPLQEAVQAVQAVQHVASTSSRWQACSRTLDLAVRFQGGAFSHDEVKQNMVKLLGLQNCQLTLMALELGELGGSYSEAKLQKPGHWLKLRIRTLSPAPATEETEALQAKLMYLHRYGHSSSLRLPGGWKWVAVVSGLASKAGSL
eukprot:g22440.t1